MPIEAIIGLPNNHLHKSHQGNRVALWASLFSHPTAIPSNPARACSIWDLYFHRPESHCVTSPPAAHHANVLPFHFALYRHQATSINQRTPQSKPLSTQNPGPNLLVTRLPWCDCISIVKADKRGCTAGTCITNHCLLIWVVCLSGRCQK